MNVDPFVSNVLTHTHCPYPLLIAIDGFGGSGKTTLAATLKEKWGDDAYVIHLDDFLIKELFEHPSWEKPFDRKRLEEQVLIPASKSKSVSYQRLVWKSNKLSKHIKIPRVKYLIVEGITSSHPDIAKYYAYKIWVDTPIDIAKERGKQRDRSMGNQFDDLWELWARNDLEYINQYHPEKKADFIIETK